MERRAEGDTETERSASRARRVRGRRRVSATAASTACNGRRRVAAAAAAPRRARGPASRFQQRCRSGWPAGQRLRRRGERAPLMNAPGGVILRAAATRPPPVCVEAVVPRVLPSACGEPRWLAGVCAARRRVRAWQGLGRARAGGARRQQRLAGRRTACSFVPDISSRAHLTREQGAHVPPRGSSRLSLRARPRIFLRYTSGRHFCATAQRLDTERCFESPCIGRGQQAARAALHS